MPGFNNNLGFIKEHTNSNINSNINSFKYSLKIIN